SSGDTAGAAGPAADRSAEDGARAAGQAAMAAGQAPSPLLPLLVVGSACVAAATLWMARRRTVR
ncbi:hypothetical protein AB0N23_08570, partial [Streptomyces sp. NPDC052644]